MALPLRFLFIALLFLALGCGSTEEEEKPRLSLFIGVDTSGSFTRTPHFKDSLRFLSYYISAHLNGIEGFGKPRALFVGSIGGDTPNEPKAFYPVQIFERKNRDEIEAKLTELFTVKGNFLTDFNAFFKRVSEVVQKQNLVLTPIVIVIVSDGVPEVIGNGKKVVRQSFEKIDVSPLEFLARNVTVRLLYASPKVSAGWERNVPRQRVRIWPVEAEIMKSWGEQVGNHAKLEDEKRLWKWIQEIVDHRVRRQKIL